MFLFFVFFLTTINLSETRVIMNKYINLKKLHT